MGRLTRATFLVLLLVAQPVWAGVQVDYEPMIEVSGGYEYQSTPGALPSDGRDDSRSGSQIVLNIELLRLTFGKENEYAREGTTLNFIPLAVEFEPSIDNLYGDHFGGFQEVGDFKHMVKRVVGALVDARYDFLDGQMHVRGKLATVEYDRDKGFWDWRAIDAEVAATHIWEPQGGDVIVDLEIRAGVGVGGIHLNAIEDIRAAAMNPGGSSDAMIVSPHLTAAAGLDFDFFKLNWNAGAEYRVDATSDRSGPTMDSLKFMTELEAAFIVTPENFSSHFEVFATARYEMDTLTAQGMFFGGMEPFHSVFVGGGVRGRF